MIAGEESGDLHASVFIRELKTKYPDFQISGIGGRHMQQAGVELISDLARFGVTGFTEVLRHLRIIKKAFKDKVISEDESKKGEADVQKITDDFIKKIDQIADEKEKSILTI